MKFNKTVAQALANKARNQLIANRSKFVNDFKLPVAKERNLKALIAEYFELTARLKEVNKSLNKFAQPCRFNDDTPETLFARYVKEIGKNQLKALPSTSNLVDDFVIESLDAANADELISKVVAKYSE